MFVGLCDIQYYLQDIRVSSCETSRAPTILLVCNKRLYKDGTFKHRNACV